LCLLSVAGLGLFSHAQDWKTDDQYIQNFAKYAVEEMELYKIPASIKLAQGILETGGGQSRLAKEGKNHFGIKCKENWTGKTMKHTDDAPNECFRVYDDPRESYRDHSLFLTTRKYYVGLFKLDIKDYKGWAYGLKKAGYATNPRYAQILINRIEKYRLHEFDNIKPHEVSAKLKELYPEYKSENQEIKSQEPVKEKSTKKEVRTEPVLNEEKPKEPVVQKQETKPETEISKQEVESGKKKEPELHKYEEGKLTEEAVLHSLNERNHPNSNLKYVVLGGDISLSALAKKYSKDTASASKGGNLGYLSKDGGLGTDLENVAFSLPKGGISDVVQTPVGYDIVQVLNIEDKVSFEHEKARIEAELKLKKAASEFNSAKEKLSEEAFNTPTSLADVAKKTNLKLESLDQDWLTQANGKAAGLPDALINAAFSEDVLKKKHNSDLISMDKDTVWVIRVKEVREEKTAPFADVQEEVRLAYLRSEAAKLADKKAKEAIEALKAGKAVDLKWSEVSKLSAQDARRTMAPEAYNELIKARPQNGKPAYAMLLEGMPAPVIVEVQNIAAPENIASQVPAAKQMLAQQQSANIFDALLRYFSKEIKREQGAQKVDNSAE